MKRNLLITFALFTLGFGAYAYDYTDDIYYNPKQTTTKKAKSSKASNYVDFSTMSVDDYNMRGQYYTSPVDTIGMYIESEPDFVYTTQIQKFYNPTIVTDNAAVIQDVLNNSYGNVEIVYNYNGTPSFVPWTSYSWAWPSWTYYNNWYAPWSFGFNFGPVSFAWNGWWGWASPSWGWNWGPAWGPAWGPGWGPGWAWNRPGPGWGGPGWGWNRPHPGWGGPGWGGPGRPMATYSPNGRAPFGGAGHGGGFGGNYNGGQPSGNVPAPGGNRRPVNTSIQHGNNIGSSSAVTQPAFTPSGRRGNITTQTPATSTTRPSGNHAASGTVVNGTTRPSSTITSSPATTVTNRPAQPTTTTRPAQPTTTTRPAQPTTTTRPAQPTTTTRPAQNSTTRPATSTSTSRPASNTSTSKPASTSRPASTSTNRNSSTSTSRPSTSTSTSRPASSGGSRMGTSSGSRGGFGGGGRSGGRR